MQNEDTIIIVVYVTQKSQLANQLEEKNYFLLDVKRHGET